MAYMQSASDTFSEALMISNWCKHCARHHDGGKSGLAMQDYLQRYKYKYRILCCVKFQEKLDPHGSRVHCFTYPL